jgi:signal transduction histidine kinase/ActR/RegA family two-component response regulator
MPDTNRRFKLEELPLRQQMLLVFSLVMLLFSVLLAAFVDRQITDAAIHGRGQQSAQDSAFFANLIDSDIEDYLADIKVRADSFQSMTWQANLPAFQTALNRLQQARTHYAWIGLADAKGKVLAATQNMLVGVDVSARPWFQKSTQGPIVVDVHDAKLLALLMPRADPLQQLRFVDLAAPVRDEQDRLIGILGAHLSVEWLSERIKRFASSRFKNDLVRPAVIGADGELRFGYADSVTGLDTRLIWQAAHDKGHGWMLLTPDGGKPTVYGFAKHRGPAVANNVQWVSVIPIDVDAIAAEVRHTRLLAMGGVVLVSLMAWITLYLLLNLVSRPVRQLMGQIRQAQDSHEPLPLLDGLPREFREIQTTVNSFLGSLRARETDLQSALDELRASFTGVSESFPGVLFQLEAKPNGGVEFNYLSPSAAHYLHVNTQSMPLSAMKLFVRDDVLADQEVLSVLTAQIAKSQALDFSFAVTGLDGVSRHMRIKGHLRGSGRGRRLWQGVIFDVSDLVTAQKAADDADQAKSRFLATMSHELRTPLNGILGFAQLLQGEMTTDSQQADLRKIIDTTEVLTRILNDILDFSKIEEGKLLIESGAFCVRELVQSCASLFEVEAQRRQLDLIVHMDLPNSTRFFGDSARLRQIINNLLSNAMKFTAEGQVRLGVTCHLKDPGQARLRITVSDTGMGMPAEAMARLFQRFEQADDSIFRRFGGSGLGLAIVRGIVEAMGGTVSVESKPDAGSTFHVDVPLAKINAFAQDAATQADDLVPGLRILVVDDVAMNRDLISRMLRANGHLISQAVDGQQALEMAQSERFDLVLMDIDMPVMGGLQASRLIRALPGVNRAVPIIALTGYAFESDVQEALSAGINAHVAKPVVFAKLKEKIRTVLVTQAQTA